VTYFVGLALLGIYFSRKQTSEVSYFLGNRRMPWLLAGVSVMATLVSTLSYLSLPGEMIRYGVGYFAAIFSYVLVIPVVSWLIIPALMRLPVTSVYEYFEKRFNLATRLLGAIVFILMRLTWVGLIIYTASFAVAEMTGWNATSVILVIGVITTFYTTAGGMQAVLWSDFVQGCLLIAGALFIPVFIAMHTGTGPVAWWDAFSQAGRVQVPIVSLDPFVRISMLGIIVETFFWHIATNSADQVAVQRYLSTSSVRAARRSFWVSAAFTIVLMLLLMLVGLALFGFYFQQSDLDAEAFQGQIAPEADDKLPQFIARELPQGLSGLLLAAILAAAMSSLSSGINSISSVVTSDMVDRLQPTASDRNKLIAAMVTALGAGLVGIGAALGVDASMRALGWNLVEMVERINHLFVAPLGALFVAGLVFRRVGSAAALLGFAAGVSTSVLVSFGGEIFALERSVSFMWIIPSSFLVSLLASYIAGRFLPPPSAAQLAALGRVKE
jgi:SSS family solute:Na+ symporter